VEFSSLVVMVETIGIPVAGASVLGPDLDPYPCLYPDPYPDRDPGLYPDLDPFPALVGVPERAVLPLPVIPSL
jgi:hypothetical protein